MFILKFIFILIGAMLSTAFFTLLEHKMLAHTQLRNGPNKVGPIGILQPFADAVKLLAKEFSCPNKSNFLLFKLSPMMGLVLSISLWLTIPSQLGSLNINLSILFILSCTALSVYSTLLAGWASYSKFSLLGSLRSVAQTLSYEVVLAMVIIMILIIFSSLSFSNKMNFSNSPTTLLLAPVFFMWMTICMAESNRTPFDFSEGESELVSGFNTEYSSSTFVFIFLAEYSSILFLSILTTTLFFTCSPTGPLFTFLTGLIAASFIWVRSTLPRLRYDKLMYLTWKLFLPTSLFISIFSLLIKLGTL